MLKAIAFGLAFGAGFQAWRNFPPDGPVTPDAAAVVLAVAVLAAYFGGRARRGSTAVAVASAEATATAQAQQHVQVAVVVPGAGAGQVRGRHAAQLPDAMPWSSPRPELELDQLDGFDFSELIEDTGSEHSEETSS